MNNKNIPVPKESQTLVEWLKFVVTTLEIHSRAEWGHVLGVTPQDIGTWLNGEKLPRPDALRDLLSTLDQRYAEQASVALKVWETLARRPLREVWPGDARTDAQTLGHYVIGPLWDDLRLAVQSQPTDIQASLLKYFIGEVNRRRLVERCYSIGSIVPLDEISPWIRAAAKDQAARDRELIGQLENYVDQKPIRETLLAEADQVRAILGASPGETLKQAAERVMRALEAIAPDVAAELFARDANEVYDRHWTEDGAPR